MLNDQAMYLNIDVISTNYPGWTMSEIRQMTPRQRNYWMDLIRWKRERARV